MKVPTAALTLFLLLATTVVVVVRAQEVVSDRLVDIGFVVDVSGSFYDDIDNFKVQAKGIVDTVTGLYPNTYFGLATFQDFPLSFWGGPGDSPHAHIHDLGRPDATFLASVNGLWANGGGDWPESQLVALHQSITGSGLVVPAVAGLHGGYEIPPGQNFHFRSGSARIIILWTDATFHTPLSTRDYPGPSMADVINAARSPPTRRRQQLRRTLQDHGSDDIGDDSVRIVGLQSGAEFGVAEAIAELAVGTGGVAGPAGVDCDGDGTVDVESGKPIICPVETGLANAIVSVIAGIVPEIPDTPASPTTARPTRSPVAPVPTAEPTALPSGSPSVPPTMAPSPNPSVAPTPHPTQSPTVFPTMTKGCAILLGCYLENIATRQRFRLDATKTTSYRIASDAQYSVRCNTKGRLYNMVFDYNGISKKESHLPYYMSGDFVRDGRFEANNVPYLSQGCGAKKVTARGRIWAGECFARTYQLEAVC